MLFTGTWLFELVFGREWSQAGLFSSILAIYLLMQFISAPIVNALSVFEQQVEFLLINVRRTILIIVVFATAYYLNLDPSSTVVIFSVVLAIHYFGVTFTIFRVIKKNVS